MLEAKILRQLQLSNSEKILENIQLAEFSVFSQWGDDGIIQFLVDYLEIENKSFIEFGVYDYEESNTRFLLMNNNWKGLVMDGSEANIKHIQKQDYYWRFDLTAEQAFITRENINKLILSKGFDGKIGLLHIDIDGNDYWVWKALNCVDATLVIIEYNAVFGADHSWTIPYNPAFQRTDAHFSNLYWGASLSCLCDLGASKGYAFVGTNSAGNNAYFIKKESLKALHPLSSREGFTMSRYRESRNESGHLTYLSGPDRIKAISGCHVFNTRSMQTEIL